MIEVNTRIWTQNNLATRCGVDIPYIAYLDILGEKVERSSQTEESVIWIDFYSDFLACFGFSGYIKRGEATLATWLKSLVGNREYAIFAKDDIRPFIKASEIFLTRLTKGFLNKMKQNSNDNGSEMHYVKNY